jgi:hypothetical protein
VYSFSAPHERLKLFSLWTIAGFGLAVGLGLLLVYPRPSLEQRLIAVGSTHPDRLTMEYLKVFLKAKPKDDTLRAELIKQLILLGAYGEAGQQLVLLRQAADPRFGVLAAWFEYQMLEDRAFAEAEGSPGRLRALAQLREKQQALLAMPLDAAQLQRLAQRSLALNDKSTADQALQKLAKNPQALGNAQNADLAQLSLGLGDYSTSAAFYFRAMQASGALDQQRDYFFTALRTLQSGNLYDEAIASADRYIGPLAGDRMTLLFLSRLAQSSNKLDAAERYIRQLLKLSMLESNCAPAVRPTGYQRMADFAQSMRQVVLYKEFRCNEHIMRVADKPGMAVNLPFDEESYLLSYNVFLAAGNLADARLLAQSAVRQRPDDAAWRKRLAEVSEWSGAPDQALAAWLAYARISGDEAGWDAVLRLGQGTFNQDALKAVFEHKLQTEPDNPKWLDLWLAQSDTAGDPQRAIALLEGRLQDGKRSRHYAPERERELGLLANIYDRSGDDAKALATLRRAQQEFGPNAHYALLIANQLYRHGKVEEAMAALQEAAATTPAGNGEFWRAHAEVARFLQQDAVARDSYRKLLSSNQQNENDIANLAALLEDKQPLAAANLAEFGFSQTGKPAFAVQVLSDRKRAGDWSGAQAFLARLPATALAPLEQDAAFLAARAEIRQFNGDIKGAAADLRAALAIHPGDANVRSDLIWTLIALRDTVALKRALTLWAADADKNALLWGPFAAANMALNRQPDALHWFRKSGFPKDDYLWLLSYAECLDANNQPDLAWRIRRKAWLELRKPEVLRNANPAQLRDMRDRLAALAPMFMQADAANRVLQALLRADVGTLTATAPEEKMAAAVDGPALLQLLERDRDQDRHAAAMAPNLKSMFAPAAGHDSRDDLRLSASVREAALAYALSADEPDLAHVWLVTRFTKQLERPLWGELSLMLAAGDRDRLDRLLDDMPDWLPMYERIDAAKLAGRDPLAQTFAFDQLAILPGDDELHQRLTGLVTQDPPAFSASVIRLRDYPLQATTMEVGSGWAVSGGTRLYVKLDDTRQSSTDSTLLANIPATDRQAELTLRRRTDSGFVAYSLSHRQAAASVNGARFDYSAALTDKLTASGNAGINQLALESILLRVGGMRSGGEADFNYALTPSEYLRTGLGWQQYASQAGTTLGSGANFNLEAGTHLRIEYPNLTLRTYASGANFKDNGTSDAQLARLVPTGIDPSTFRYMPVNTRVYGVSLGAGTVVENTYTRAWRPFAEIGATFTPDLGWGHNLRAGLSGSVIGQDALSVVFESVSGTVNSPQTTIQLGVNYKWLY